MAADRVMSVGVLTVSDRCARGQQDDGSGEKIVQWCVYAFLVEKLGFYYLAVQLMNVVADARGLDPDWASVADRGAHGPRGSGEVGVHAMRAGESVGEHTLVLAGPGELLELSHRAQSRDIFARGAVRAAHWVVGKAPALYGMPDVLGLNE